MFWHQNDGPYVHSFMPRGCTCLRAISTSTCKPLTAGPGRKQGEKLLNDGCTTAAGSLIIITGLLDFRAIIVDVYTATSCVFFFTYQWPTVVQWRTARKRRVCQRGANGPRWPWRWSRPGCRWNETRARSDDGVPAVRYGHARATRRWKRENDYIGITTTISR